MDSKALISLDAFTEEIWVKSYYSSLPTDIKLFSSSQYYLDIAPSTNLMTLYLLDSITQLPTSDQTTRTLFLYDTWSHFLVQYSGSSSPTPTLRALLNGREIASIQGTLQVYLFLDLVADIRI